MNDIINNYKLGFFKKKSVLDLVTTIVIVIV